MSIYLCSTMQMCSLQETSRVKRMDRPLAVGATSGSVSALLIRFLSEIASRSSDPIFECPICPDLEFWDFLKLERVDLPSLCLGLLCGLLLGPILDLVHLGRQTWRIWLQQRLRQLHREPGALYKLA